MQKLMNEGRGETPTPLWVEPWGFHPDLISANLTATAYIATGACDFGRIQGASKLFVKVAGNTALRSSTAHAAAIELLAHILFSVFDALPLRRGASTFDY
jgi:hypothetical protein